MFSIGGPSGVSKKRKLRVSEVTMADPKSIVLAHFPGGMMRNIPDRTVMYEKPTDANNRILVSREKDVPVQYIGRKSGAKTYLDDVCKYGIAVADMKTKKVKIMEVPDLFMMEWNIKETENEDNTTAIDSEEKVSSEEQKRMLVEAFGSKQNKKRLHIQQISIVHPDSESVGIALQNVLTQAAEEKEIPEMKSLKIPPIHPEADTLKEAFVLFHLIPKGEYLSINNKPLLEVSESGELLQQMRDSGSVPEFVLQRIPQLFKHKKAAPKSASILLYITYLYRLYKIAEAFQKRFFREEPFGNKGIMRLTQSKDLKDYLILYICALCILVDNFSFDPTFLAKDLGISLSKIKTFFSVIGCRFSLKADANVRKIAFWDILSPPDKEGKGPWVWVELPMKFATVPRKAARKQKT